MGGERWVVVTPVYEDRESFAALCRALAAQPLGVELHVVAVDDGSLTAPPMQSDIAAAGLNGEILHLARNVGHQAAIAIGLVHAAGIERLAGCIIMDSDGEDAPEALASLIDAIRSTEFDVAVARRAKRSESLPFRAFYILYRQAFRILTGQVIRFGNFMALTPRALRRLAAMHESWTHVAGAVVKARLRRAEIPIDRARRYYGQSKMNFVSLVLHGMRAVMVFGDAVVTRMAVVCAVMAGITSVSIVMALLLKLIGMATPGWVTSVTGFSLSLFLQTGILALITLLMNGAGRLEAPAALAARARDTVESIERATAIRKVHA
jgi:polyisoprenyl-phosphate glycosyltransferase